jgi:hypothetical protein
VLSRCFGDAPPMKSKREPYVNDRRLLDTIR